LKKVFFSLVCFLLPLLTPAAAAGTSVPPGTSIDNQASVTFQESTGISISSTSNIVHVIAQAAAGASLVINKTASKSSVNAGDQLTYTLAVSNNGSSDAAAIAVVIDGIAGSRIVVRDAIPPNTQFSAATGTGPGGVVYHLLGAPTQTYVSAIPADLSTVDSIAFVQPSFVSGTAATFSFTVAVDRNASGTVRNTAVAFYNSGVDTSSPSNEVDVSVSGPAPNISYFSNNIFNQAIHSTPIGAPLWIQVDAAACNVDPTAIETKSVTLKSLLTGDTETFTATETGPNTGIFRILPAVPSRDASQNPPVSGNKIMEVLRNDQLIASFSGCGATTVSATILIDPTGVVFDSHSDALIAGAAVTLIDVTGAGNGGHANAPAAVLQFDGITPAPSTVTTSADGRFQFPQVLPSTYRVSVKPPSSFSFPSTLSPGQLPPDRRIDSSGSYNGTFLVTASNGIVIFDVPVDASSTTPLFVEKTADRGTVNLGEFVDYTIEVKNLLSSPQANVQVNDTLPPGFMYIKHTARLNGSVMSDPIGGKGPQLGFSIGTLVANADVKLSYRVLVGAGAATGYSINRAIAVSGPIQSNVASARVNVQGGMFSNNGFIVGKVFQDCNGNKVQDQGEFGVPGVRVYLDDGTFAITDEEGRYSIYGVPGRTHILKVDTSSVPANTNFEAISSRNAGVGSSRFIDLKFGEMQKADFAISNCTSAMAEDIKLRRQKLAGQNELTRAVKAQFNTNTVEKDSSQLKSLAPNGFVDPAALPGKVAVTTPEAPIKTAVAEPAAAAAITATELAGLTNDLGFVDLHDHAVMPFAQTTVRVKGRMGASFKLLVNGKEASSKQIGSKSTIADKQLQVWEFVGVNLQPGKNLIEVKETDPFGNDRGAETIELVAPSKLGKLSLDIPKTLHAADGKTPVKVTLRLTDAQDVPVTVRTAVTLEATNGVWLVKDLNPNEPGTQIFVENGRVDLELMPPIEPGSSMIKASSGAASVETKVEFVPELRPMMAVGLVEYQINFGSRGQSAVQPALDSTFESELRLFGSSSGNNFDSGGHATLLLKGKIKGDNLLTLAYDSDKTTGERLFRDIQPDQFYPVYGDASVRGYDAQSTSKAYVRIDHGKTYLLYGDYVTSDPGVSNSLGNYSRSMTGAKQHFENDKVSLTGFASYDSLTQQVQEFIANGTSGPFTLSNPNGVENSEKIEVLVRDRNQPSVIIQITQLSRFSDYEFEPFTGQLLLKAPIPTLDSNLNLLSIRVTYEVNQGGERFWVGGGTGQIKVNSMLQMGGTFVQDSNPQDPNRLFAVNSTLKLPLKTAFTAEFAGTQHDIEGTGLGYRVELQHDGDKLKGKAYFSRTDPEFNNPTSVINQGRGESGVKTSYALTGSTRLLGEFIRTEDVLNAGTRQGGEFSLEKTFPGNIQTRFGYRHAEETAAPASASSVTPDIIAPAPSTSSAITPNSLNTLFSKLSLQMPHFTKMTATAEYEQDMAQSDKRMMALGATYQLWDKGRVYFRQELISSLGDVYSLNSLQHRNTTQIGIESAYYKDARVFSEYRIQDLSNGREAEAALGLRNTWHFAKGLTGNTSVESIRTLNGTDVNALALTGGVEYTAHENWKGSARMEWRGSTATDSFLSTLGFAARLSDSWSFLGRNILSSVTTNASSGSTGGTLFQDRLQFGFALRDMHKNRWNALNLFELKDNRDNSQPLVASHSKTGILATTANYQISAPLIVSGRYAIQWNVAGGSAAVPGVTSAATMQLAGGRATWDVTRKWDFGVAASSLSSLGMDSRQYGLGFETGYQIIGNMWLSTGYNFVGFVAADLAGDNVTRRGAFIRMRFKFDESIFAPRAKK
jgi:uncharacterized repeat protein (TIGR01451 family)